ncbi:HTH-type transcriptional regulator MalT [Psychromonas antarctica]|uniref:HTH-type transcriptional regulator MalT n=1 Tax=Psychromonas antarctica TaxID=67573 RepID=UPI001EE88456|nr:HTH-type transcriptional regulator MalT [Psychromonas antarctica]MCG6200145.1 HTH-type transcriptional regulator MalT [Psychromonas antarctica]
MIIRSKLSAPAALKNGILRERLMHNLADARLGLICAPAGYGKSTAIADWTKNKKNLAWFTIDRFDDNTSQFCNYFIHAIKQIQAISCPASLEAVKQSQYPDLINLFTLFISELAEFNVPICIVLDDYHHIKNPVIHQGLAFFIKNMPAKWQLLIASRTSPPLPVSTLRIKQQLFEINETDLAFTDLETDNFFSKCTTFFRDPVKQQALRENVDGWPTALQLVSILSKDTASFNACAEQIGKSNHAYLWDYLEEEVFSPLNATLQALLLTIAPLNKVDANIVNKLCNIDDGQVQLERLQEQGAFIVAVDNQQDWFTFHSFFKAFLLHKCKHTPNFKCDHKKIASLWLERGNIEEALPHALKSQNEQLIIDLLKEAGWQLFDAGQLNSLEECFSLIRDAVWDNPDLILLELWMLQSRHQGYKVVPLIKKAELIFAEQNIVLSEQLKNEFAVIHAQIAINHGKIDSALKQAEKTLLSVESNSTRVNIVAQAIVGEAYHCLGKLPLAYQYFQEVKKLASLQNMHQNVIWALYQQGEILHAQSNHVEADRHIDAAISSINRYRLQKLPLYAFPLHFKAQQAYQEGDFDLAERLCAQALKVISPYGEQWRVYTYTLQAKIALEKNDLQQGGLLVEEIERLLRNQHFHSDWIAAANYTRIKYWRATKDITAIERWLASGPRPKNAFNHFDQCHNRNRARAFIQLGELQTAHNILEKNINDAQQYQLQMEINRNLILLTSVESLLKQFTNAKIHLTQALELSLQTGLNTCFVREAVNLKPVYQELANDSSLINSVKEKLAYLLLLSGINLNETPKNPFDPASVSKIQAHPRTPRLVKNIQLTPREWQVLGFIHSGYRNHQIAKAMAVAPTTVKSHIRNVYQKLGLEDRNEALLLSSELVGLIE